MTKVISKKDIRISRMIDNQLVVYDLKGGEVINVEEGHVNFLLKTGKVNLA